MSLPNCKFRITLAIFGCRCPQGAITSWGRGTSRAPASTEHTGEGIRPMCPHMVMVQTHWLRQLSPLYMDSHITTRSQESADFGRFGLVFRVRLWIIRPLSGEVRAVFRRGGMGSGALPRQAEYARVFRIIGLRPLLFPASGPAGCAKRNAIGDDRGTRGIYSDVRSRRWSSCPADAGNRFWSADGRSIRHEPARSRCQRQVDA